MSLNDGSVRLIEDVEIQPVSVSTGRSIEIGMDVVNLTGFNIVVKDRRNIGYWVPTEHNRHVDGFGFLYVVTTYNFTDSVNPDIQKPFCETGKEQGESQYDETLRSLLYRDYHNPQNGTGPFTTGSGGRARVEYKIPVTEIEGGGAVYVPKLDLLFYTAPYNTKDQTVFEKHNHPYSEAGKNRRFVDQVNGEINVDGKDLTNSFVFAMKIVDNNKTIGERFINVHNDVYRIKAVTDDTLESGLYVYRSVPANRRDRRSERYNLPLDVLTKEEGFYNTIEEAKTFGDPKRLRDEELERLKHNTLREQEEYKQKKTKLDAEKAETIHKFDMEKLKLEQETAQLKRENEEQAEKIKTQQEEIRQRNKEEAERRSYQRKDFNDTLKFITVVVTTVGSLAFAFAKASKGGK